MTEPRDDEAGREALVERFALALVSNPAWYENAVKASHADGPRLAEQVWARAHDIVYARPAPPAATAPSGEDSLGALPAMETPRPRTISGAGNVSASCDEGSQTPPRDEAAALLREAREVLERYAVGWTDDGRSFDNVAVIAMRARIDAYLRALASAALAAQPAAGRGREDGYGIDLSNIRLSELPPFGKVYRYSEKDDAWLPTERAPGPEGGERSA
jgi:hypothetical protein